VRYAIPFPFADTYNTVATPYAASVLVVSDPSVERSVPTVPFMIVIVELALLIIVTTIPAGILDGTVIFPPVLVIVLPVSVATSV
jgi:hypothetical protein